jgi:hypothetical protein
LSLLLPGRSSILTVLAPPIRRAIRGFGGGDVRRHRLSTRHPHALTLHNHVAGLEGLRRELTFFGTRELGARLERAAVGGATDKTVVALGEAYRAFVEERPGLYAATVRASRRLETEDP